jgi:mannose-1-phosphate guanylyltransferase
MNFLLTTGVDMNRNLTLPPAGFGMISAKKDEQVYKVFKYNVYAVACTREKQSRKKSFKSYFSDCRFYWNRRREVFLFSKELEFL